MNTSDQIKEISTNAKKEIYYLIKNKYFDQSESIKNNYFAGMLTFAESTKQNEDISAQALKSLKENNISEEETLKF
jgi:hypothetical protein